MYSAYYLYVCIQKFFCHAWLRLEKEHQKEKKKERDGDIGKHKLNEMGVLNMR